MKPIDKALAHIDVAVLAARSAGTTRLSATRRLAADAGVGLVTMWKAVQRRAREGVLDVHPARLGAILVAGGDETGVKANANGSSVQTDFTSRQQEQSPASRAFPQPASPAWERARASILAEMERGFGNTGPGLPAAKLLRSRYRTSFASVKKALESLASDGFIERDRRGYRVREAPRSRRGRPVLVFVTITNQMHLLSGWMPWSQEFWRLLEMQCLERDIPFRMQDYNTTIAQRPGAEDVLAMVVWTPSMTHEMLDTLGAHLVAFRCPVAFIDETAADHLPPAAAGNPLVRYLSLSVGRTCGLDMGNSLYRLGHRRVAAIFRPGGDRSLGGRCDGIAEAFARAGLPDAVVRVGHDAPRWESESAASFPERVRAGFMQVSGRAPEDTLTSALVQHASNTVAEHALGQSLEPVFADLLGDSSITAWVALDDQVAILAFQFIRARGIALGGRLSLCGFDDNVDTFGRGITSYNFNMPAMVNAVFAHITGPARSRLRRARVAQCVEIPGRVMVRGSTVAPVRS